MKRPNLAIAVEWGGTLGAAGLWTVTGVWHEFPTLTPVLVFPSRAHLAAGLGLIVLALVARWFRTGHLFRRTPFDLPILLFLLGAAIGWGCAYNRELGLLKLHFLISAITIYYLLAGAGPTAVSRFILGFVLLSAVLAVLSITQHDLATLSPFLAWIGLLLNRTAPEFRMSLPNPNTIAGILELAVPFNLLWIYVALSPARKQDRESPSDAEESSGNHRGFALSVRMLHIGASILTLVCIAFGLLLTGSRGAWIALAGAAGLGLVQRGSIRLSKQLLGHSKLARWVGTGVVLVVVLIGLGLYGMVLTRPSWLGTLPGGVAARGYMDVFQNAFYQARDYFFTGSGLGAFQMVYSTYSLLIHTGFIPDAHNLYLQIWLEQGLLGIGALLSMAGITVWLMASGSEKSPWNTRAAGWAIIVILLHGLADAPLYGYEPWSTLFLFVPFGLFVSGQPMLDPVHATAPSGSPEGSRQKTPLYAQAALLVVILGAGTIWRRPILSTAFSDLGAVEQTRIELGVYSRPEWPIQDEVRRQMDMSRPVAAFQRALAYNPRNATANRRLGMIALSLGEYAAALEYLEAANAITPEDNATRQLLGEAYIVNGRLDEGAALWSSVNNGQSQLYIRAWWYDKIGDVQRADWMREVIQRVTR